MPVHVRTDEQTYRETYQSPITNLPGLLVRTQAPPHQMADAVKMMSESDSHQTQPRNKPLLVRRFSSHHRGGHMVVCMYWKNHLSPSEPPGCSGSAESEIRALGTKRTSDKMPTTKKQSRPMGNHPVGTLNPWPGTRLSLRFGETKESAFSRGRCTHSRRGTHTKKQASAREGGRERERERDSTLPAKRSLYRV